MIQHYLNLLTKVNIVKTLFINFKMLPLRKAIKIPILVYYRTEIINLSGRININCKIETGLIQFNNVNDEFLGKHHWRRIEILGDVSINGKIESLKISRFFSANL